LPPCAGYVTAIVPAVARNDAVTVALAALIGAAAVDGYRRSSGPVRKAGRITLGASLAYAGVLALGVAARSAGWPAELTTLVLYDFFVAATVMVMVAGLRFGHWSGSAGADLVIALGRDASASLQSQLRLAMGDPSVVVGYWAVDRYVDELGIELLLPAGPLRVVTPVDNAGEPLAVLVHDAAAAQDEELLAAVTSAARLAITNIRLRAGIRDRAAELARSRRRIVEAADRQRQELAAGLAAGTGERLDRVERGLAGLHTDDADDLRAELAGTRAELVDLANGVRPAALTAGGLPAALPWLAGRSPVPVDLTVRVGRLPAAIEACVYFVCAEALTNAVKHAAADHIRVAVRHQDAVVAAIGDDGSGGADPSAGTGLRGLADRVEALGGTLTIDSAPGEGTTVVATLPG
jgi:signal transduction histidine kinase